MSNLPHDTLELTSDQQGRVASIVCRGTLELATTMELRARIDTALATPKVLLCLDLEDVTFVDSTGLRLVVATIERCAEHHVHLELWPGAAVERLLHLASVTVPLRAYPARPSQLFPETGWAE